MTTTFWIKSWPIKDPDSFLPYYFDWSLWSAIELGGNIASYNLAIEDGVDSALVLSDFAQGSGDFINWIQVWIRGGTAGAIYKVRCRVTLEDGRTEDASRLLPLASK